MAAVASRHAGLINFVPIVLYLFDFVMFSRLTATHRLFRVIRKALCFSTVRPSVRACVCTGAPA